MVVNPNNLNLPLVNLVLKEPTIKFLEVHHVLIAAFLVHIIVKKQVPNHQKKPVYRVQSDLFAALVFVPFVLKVRTMTK